MEQARKRKKTKENSSEDDKNPKHRKRNWSEVVKGSPEGGADVPIKSGAIYTGEEALAMLTVAKEVAGE